MIPDSESLFALSMTRNRILVSSFAAVYASFVGYQYIVVYWD
jgi:hypothetical protein